MDKYLEIARMATLLPIESSELSLTYKKKT